MSKIRPVWSCDLLPLYHVCVVMCFQHHMQPIKQPEFPIFKRQDADLLGQASGITSLCVSSGWVSLIMVGNIIYRYNIASPGRMERKWKSRISKHTRFFNLSTHTIDIVTRPHPAVIAMHNHTYQQMPCRSHLPIHT